jgi:hypothetical protein
MPPFLRRIIDRVKAIGRRVQAAAVVAGLWLLYWLGFGAVRAVVAVFRRDLLAEPSDDALWQPLGPAESDPATFVNQS